MRKVIIPTRGFPAYAFVAESTVITFWILCIVAAFTLNVLWKKGVVNV